MLRRRGWIAISEDLVVGCLAVSDLHDVAPDDEVGSDENSVGRWVELDQRARPVLGDIGDNRVMGGAMTVVEHDQLVAGEELDLEQVELQLVRPDVIVLRGKVDRDQQLTSEQLDQ